MLAVLICEGGNKKMLAPMMVKLAFLAAVTILICYHDIRYRRIPNLFVLATFIVGLMINAALSGYKGLMTSVEGCLLAFSLMLVMHIVGAMGAGDVKLFASVGSVLGSGLVIPTFLIVALTGGVLALYCMIRSGAVSTTMWRVFQIFIGMLPGYHMPKFAVPPDKRYTIPYGVAITVGSLISLVVFRS